MAESIKVPLAIESEEFDAWLVSIRLLVSQIRFALDNYLASRPPS